MSDQREPILDLDARIAALNPEERGRRLIPRLGGVIGGIWSWFMALPLAAKIFVAIVAIAGLMYLSRMLSRPRFDLGVARTYGFNPRRNTSGIGLPVTIHYGEHRVFPAVVNEYISVAGDVETLNRLCVVSEGEIEAITAAEINDQDAGKFTGASMVTRPGTATQTAIPGFEDTRNTYAVGVDLLDNARNFTYTTFTSIDQFIAKIKYPGGLSDVGGGSPTTITIRIEYRRIGVVPYTLLGDFVHSSTSGKPVAKQHASGTLTRDRYDVKVTRQASTGPSRACTYDSVDEIVVQATPNSYPNVALAALVVQASEQLSGEARFSVLAKGRKVRTLTGGVLSTTETWSQNPVECLIDLMTNKRYGLGGYIADADLTLSTFQTVKDYCNELVGNPPEKRHLLDLVLDEQKSAGEWTEQILNTFRGLLIESDGKYRLMMDHITAVSQVFTNANIERSSLSMTWVSLSEEFDGVEVFYVDKDLYYTRTSVKKPATGATKVKQIDGRGITRRTAAAREAQYHLNVITLLSRFVEFNCAIEAMAVDVGDVINLQHHVPQWGFGGRVVSAAVVGPDHAVTVDVGDLPTAGLAGHVLGVRHANDVIEERNVATVGPPTTSPEGYPRQVVTVTGTYGQLPASRDAVWVFGKV